MIKDTDNEFLKFLDEMSDEEFEKLVEECEKEMELGEYDYILQDHPPYLVGYRKEVNNLE